MRLPVPRSLRRSLAVAAGLALLTPLGGFAPAGAAAEEEAHPFDVFANCPVAQLVADGHGNELCISSVVTGGEFVIGKGTVPITAESQLSTAQANVGDEQVTYGVPGKVFTSSPMQVPGGLLGVPGLERLLPGLTDVTATVELATDEVPEINVVNSLFGGEVVALPVKIRLKNALLGPKCYIGSNADPIVLSLSIGPTSPPAPNEPIRGKRGTLNNVPVGTTGAVLQSNDSILVDNAFAVPAARGCGLGGLLNGVVNQRQGLPSPAGHNTAILETDSYLGGPASEVLAYQQG